MVADTFIKRPILASVCSLVIILAGAIAIPDAADRPVSRSWRPRRCTVNAFYQGASAQVVESAVTTPIEQAINGVEGMQYMTSSSGSNGTSTVTVTFDVTRNLDVAAVDVQNRVSQVEGRLPNEVKTVGLSVTKSGNNFVLAAGVYADNDQYDPLFISNYIDRFVRTTSSASPALATSSSSASASTRCACGWTPTAWPAAASWPPRWSTRCASRTCRWRPGRSAPNRRGLGRSTRSACARSAA